MGEDESPLGNTEVRQQLSNLKDADRLGEPLGHDTEAGIGAGRPLLRGPLDEPLETSRRRRWRRNELGDLIVGQHREERCRISPSELSQHYAFAVQRGQVIAPAAHGVPGVA
jgi:hypothetical protein